MEREVITIEESRDNLTLRIFVDGPDLRAEYVVDGEVALRDTNMSGAENFVNWAFGRGVKETMVWFEMMASVLRKAGLEESAKMFDKNIARMKDLIAKGVLQRRIDA